MKKRVVIFNLFFGSPEPEAGIKWRFKIVDYRSGVLKAMRAREKLGMPVSWEGRDEIEHLLNKAVGRPAKYALKKIGENHFCITLRSVGRGGKKDSRPHHERWSIKLCLLAKKAYRNFSGEEMLSAGVGIETPKIESITE